MFADLEDPPARSYRKRVTADGRIVSAILLGAGSSETATVRAAISRQDEITGQLRELRAGALGDPLGLRRRSYEVPDGRAQVAA